MTKTTFFHDKWKHLSVVAFLPTVIYYSPGKNVYCILQSDVSLSFFLLQSSAFGIGARSKENFIFLWCFCFQVLWSVSTIFSYISYFTLQKYTYEEKELQWNCAIQMSNFIWNSHFLPGSFQFCPPGGVYIKILMFTLSWVCLLFWQLFVYSLRSVYIEYYRTTQNAT